MNTFYSCWIGASFSIAVTLYNQEEADFKLFCVFFFALVETCQVQSLWQTNCCDSNTSLHSTFPPTSSFNVGVFRLRGVFAMDTHAILKWLNTLTAT